MKFDATGMDHRQLNTRIRGGIDRGETQFDIANVIGQRYVAAGVTNPISITIDGVPGNDLGAFMDGPRIRVNGNGQDGVGNTMNSGLIVIDGDARDLTGHSMRGGRIYVRGDVGYRVGIHMKSYERLFPVIVVGGRAGDFTGEYMAGGVIVILNLRASAEQPVVYLAGLRHGRRQHVLQLGDGQIAHAPNVEPYHSVPVAHLLRLHNALLVRWLRLTWPQPSYLWTRSTPRWPGQRTSRSSSRSGRARGSGRRRPS